MAITLRLPIPPKELHPNSRAHWRVAQQAKKAYRETVRVKAWELRTTGRPDLPWPMPPGVEADVVFVYRSNRRRDTDNLNAWLKAAWDGIVRGGLLADDSANHLTVNPARCVVLSGKSSGFVLVTLKIKIRKP